MSENLDLVRSIYADWERGDFSSAEWARPDIEYVVPDGPEPRESAGLAAMAQTMRNWLSAWEEVQVEATEYRELDDEHVLVLTRLRGRGKASGLEIAPMRPSGADIVQVREGQVTSLVSYWDRDRALADLGLEG
jgi:ketosteroid isomerase-like protein